MIVSHFRHWRIPEKGTLVVSKIIENDKDWTQVLILNARYGKTISTRINHTTIHLEMTTTNLRQQLSQ